jgi:hypothetical protein
MDNPESYSGPEVGFEEITGTISNYAPNPSPDGNLSTTDFLLP